MTTPYVLDFALDGVRLLKGSGEEAALLGEVRLDDPAMGRRLEDLRRTAEADAEGPVAAKLLVPHNEILSLLLEPDNGAASKADRDAQVRQALAGHRPGPVEDLAYDWKLDPDGRIRVAAVPRQTLRQAEEFAVAQGIHPVHFSAHADPGLFRGAPDFGPTDRPAPARPAASGASSGKADDALASPAVAMHAAGPAIGADTSAGTDGAAPSGSPSAASPQPTDDIASRLARTARRGGTAASEDGRVQGRHRPEPPLGPTPRGTDAARPPRFGLEDPGESIVAPGGTEPAGLFAPIRPSREEAETLARPVPDEPRAARASALVPAIFGLAAALFLAAGGWATFFVLSDSASAPPEAEVAALRNAGDEGPEPAGVAPAPRSPPAGETAAEAVPAPGPADPLRRPDGAPEARRYAAAGIRTAPPSPAADDSIAEPVATVPDPITALVPPDSPAITLPIAVLGPPPSGAEREPDPIGAAIAAEGGTTARPVVRVTAGRPAAVPPPAPDRLRARTAPAGAGMDVAVTIGVPPAVPPARPPGNLAIDPPSEQASGDAESAAPVATVEATSSAANSDLRAGDIAAPIAPRARPDRGAPEVAIDGAVEDAVVDEVVAALTAPRSRPDEAPTADTGAEGPAEGAVAAHPAAVLHSLRPDSRPGGLGGSRAEPARAAAADAILPPREPASEPVAPDATVRNTLRLGQMNLIGVYGTQSNRRALVRLPNGRFVKVQVGDRVDGGRVSAIGLDELRYIKGGRAVSLSMPRG